MTTPKNGRLVQECGSECFGLLANGSSGEWEVAIDESTSGPDRWFAQIEGPSISFYFEIPSVEIVGELLGFLESPPVTAKISSDGLSELNGSLVLSKDKKTPVTLLRDDEYPDRFFLVVGLTDKPIVRFVIGGVDVLNLTDALRQVKDDLSNKD